MHAHRRYLLAGEATSSINGRSFIQTAYRASSYGKPVGEPLIVKYSQNKVRECVSVLVKIAKSIIS